MNAMCTYCIQHTIPTTSNAHPRLYGNKPAREDIEKRCFVFFSSMKLSVVLQLAAGWALSDFMLPYSARATVLPVKPTKKPMTTVCSCDVKVPVVVEEPFNKRVDVY